jgi:hypothetical protein
MAQEADLNIKAKATFTGKKAFKEAETATQKLSKSAKTLGRNLGIAFSTTAIIAYSKASVKAFVADDNAARSLSMTLKNLGLESGGAALGVNNFISELEKSTGVLDDELRPAMDRLLRATGSVTDSQKLLGLALDISAGTGKNLTQVSQGLQKAYLGNNASLGRLGVGLSKTELTSSSFLDIQARLTTLFAGQASSAAESYAGQLNKLTVAGNNAKEVIGKGIVQALTESSNGFGDATDEIDRYSNSISNMILETGRFFRLAAKLPSFFDMVKNPIGAFDDYFNEADKIEGQRRGYNNKKLFAGKGSGYADTISPSSALAGAATRSKIAKEKAAELKLLKDKNTQTILENKLKKDQATLDDAKKKFDLERIGLEAALAKETDVEMRARIKLQLAILDENAAGVKKAGDNLTAVQDKAAASLKALGESSVLAAGNLIASAMQVRAATDNPFGSLASKVGVVTTNAFATAGTNVGNGPDALLDQKWAALLAAMQKAAEALTKGNTVTVVDNTSGLITVVQDAIVQNQMQGNRSTGAGSLVIV